MDGILGFPILEHFVVDLDFQKRVLTLQPAKGYKYRGNGDVLLLSQKKYPAAIPVVLGTYSDTQHDVIVEVDTGSDATLLLYSRFARKAGLFQDMRKPQDRQVYGIGGFFPIQIATLRFMALGSTAVSPLSVLFMQTTPTASSKKKIGGVIGTAVLAMYERVIFDIPRKRIILEHLPLPTTQSSVELAR